MKFKEIKLRSSTMQSGYLTQIYMATGVDNKLYSIIKQKKDGKWIERVECMNDSVWLRKDYDR